MRPYRPGVTRRCPVGERRYARAADEPETVAAAVRSHGGRACRWWIWTGSRSPTTSSVTGGQPWVLTPGGRFTKEVGGLPETARALAATGRQIVLWDRPNCGASSVVFRGRSESEVQAEALGALLRHLDLGPAVIAGGSGGARSNNT